MAIIARVRKARKQIRIRGGIPLIVSYQIAIIRVFIHFTRKYTYDKTMNESFRDFFFQNYYTRDF